MTQIHVDPEKLRSFAKELKGFADLSASTNAGIQAQLQRLGGTWRDQEHQRFVQEFKKTQQLLHAFGEEVGRMTPLLEQDAQAIEDYQRVQR